MYPRRRSVFVPPYTVVNAMRYIQKVVHRLKALIRFRAMPAKREYVNDLTELERKLRLTRQQIRTLQVMAMRPGQSPAQLKLLRDLELSARAVVKVHLKSIEEKA